MRILSILLLLAGAFLLVYGGSVQEIFILLAGMVAGAGGVALWATETKPQLDDGGRAAQLEVQVGDLKEQVQRLREERGFLRELYSGKSAEDGF